MYFEYQHWCWCSFWCRQPNGEWVLFITRWHTAKGAQHVCQPASQSSRLWLWLWPAVMMKCCHSYFYVKHLLNKRRQKREWKTKKNKKKQPHEKFLSTAAMNSTMPTTNKNSQTDGVLGCHLSATTFYVSSLHERRIFECNGVNFASDDVVMLVAVAWLGLACVSLCLRRLCICILAYACILWVIHLLSPEWYHVDLYVCV